MKNYLKNLYQNNFTYKGKEKLSKLTIFFIIVLNVIIYYVLHLGIDFQTKVLNSPSVTFPYKCRDIINSKYLDDFNQYFYSNDDYNYYDENSKYQNIKNEQIDLRCEDIFTKLELIKNEHDIKRLKNDLKVVLNNESKTNNEIYYIKENYNTVLFEKMSSQKGEQSIIKDNLNNQNIKEKYDAYLAQLEEIKKNKDNLYKEFKESKSVKELVNYVNIKKDEINDSIKEFTKAYYLKIELITLSFLLPLVVLFFYLMKRYLKKEKYILYIIFKNILFVALIPTIISVLSLINQYLPKIFIEKLLMFFYSIEIPFVVYYFVVIVFVITFTILIIKIQKRFKENSEKLKNNKITIVDSYNKSCCNNCGNKVDFNTMNYCPCCKNQLKIECNNCHEMTIKELDYCFKCGSEIKKLNKM